MEFRLSRRNPGGLVKKIEKKWALGNVPGPFQRKIIAQQCKYFMQLAWKASNY